MFRVCDSPLICPEEECLNFFEIEERKMGKLTKNPILHSLPLHANIPQKLV